MSPTPSEDDQASHPVAVERESQSQGTNPSGSSHLSDQREENPDSNPDGSSHGRRQVILRKPDPGELITLFQRLILNDLVTDEISPQIPVKGFTRFALWVFIDSTGAPTDVRIQPVFSDPVDGRWFEHRQGVFASLFYEDVDTAGGLGDVFNGPVVGDSMAVRVVATGTTATLLFEVTIRVQFFH